MIEQQLIDTLKDCIELDLEIDPSLVSELLKNHISLIEDNAELHKVNAKLRTENKELYQESAKDKGL